MLRNWIRMDDRSIEGKVNGRYFYLYWTEIAAAWVYERQRRHFLCLGTRDATLVIPLRFFNRQAVWQQLSALAQPAALTEAAIARLPAYQQWTNQNRQQAEKAQPEADGVPADGLASVADHWLIQVVGWSGVTFFLLGVLDAISAGRFAQAVLFVALMLPSGVLLLSWGLTEFSSCSVERYTLFGKWTIDWENVRRIEIDVFGSVIVLIGEDSQLSIPGPGLWTGVERSAAQSILLAQAVKRGIPVQRSLWAAFKFSRRLRSQRTHKRISK